MPWLAVRLGPASFHRCRGVSDTPIWSRFVPAYSVLVARDGRQPLVRSAVLNETLGALLSGPHCSVSSTERGHCVSPEARLLCASGLCRLCPSTRRPFHLPPLCDLGALGPLARQSSLVPPLPSSAPASPVLTSPLSCLLPWHARALRSVLSAASQRDRALRVFVGSGKLKRTKGKLSCKRFAFQMGCSGPGRRPSPDATWLDPGLGLPASRPWELSVCC